MYVCHAFGGTNGRQDTPTKDTHNPMRKGCNAMPPWHVPLANATNNTTWCGTLPRAMKTPYEFHNRKGATVRKNEAACSVAGECQGGQRRRRLWRLCPLPPLVNTAPPSTDWHVELQGQATRGIHHGSGLDWCSHTE